MTPQESRAAYDPPHELVGHRCHLAYGFGDGVIAAVLTERGLYLVRHDDGIKGLWKPQDVDVE